jgi:hypothetical protein
MSELLEQCQNMEKDLNYIDVCFSIIDKLLLHAARYKGVNAIAIKELPGHNDLCSVYYTTKEDAFKPGSCGLGCNESLKVIDIKALTLEKTAEHYKELGFYTETKYIESIRYVVGITMISWEV